MTEMFGLLKELTTSRAPEKVLIRDEAKSPITKNVNSISLTSREEERSKNSDITASDDIENPTKTETEMPVKEAKKEDEAENEPNRTVRKEETTRAPSSQPIEYYLKHMINKKLIKGLVDNHRKEEIGGNFKIPCNIGGLKHMNTLVDQGSDVNVMSLSTYMKLTDERLTETDIRLSLAGHSYIYPLEIAKDVLVEVAEHAYPIDFMILNMKEEEKRPFILGTPFLTTAKAVIKSDKVTITLRSGKSKISFHRIPESLYLIEGKQSLSVEEFDNAQIEVIGWCVLYTPSHGADPSIHFIIREILEEFRTSSGPSDAGGNPPPVTIHTWRERFNKQKPRLFKKATAPVDAEN
nr:hypothetical protein [Tanacetum cinerariifolium]